MSMTLERQAVAAEAPRRELDLRDIVDIWYRRRFLVISIVVLTMIGVEFANFVVFPTYESQVKILIEGQTGSEIPFSRDNMVFKKTEITQTQAEILMSQPNLERVVTTLKLDERPKPSGSLRAAIHALKDRVIEFVYDTREKVKEFVLVRVFGASYRPPRKPTPFEMAMGHLKKSATLSVEPMSNTDLILVTVRDYEPEYAERIANALAAAFSEHELQARIERATEVRDSIEKRLTIVEPELREAREAVAKFKHENHIVNIERQIDAALEKLAMLELSYWDLSQKESVRRLSTWEALQRETSSLRDLSQREKTSLISTLSELAELESKYQADHPKVIAARAAVEELFKQLHLDQPAPADPNLSQVPPADTESLRQDLRTRIDKTQEELAALSDLDSQYQAMVWNQDHVGEVYKFLVRKREDASIAEFTTQSQARIVQQAEPQFDPVRPRKWLNRGLGLLSALSVAIGLCAALEYLDRTLRTPEGVARVVGLKTLGSIPYVSG